MMAFCQPCGRISPLFWGGLGLLLVSGCMQAQSSEAPANAPAVVISTTPLKISLVEWDEYVGRLEPIHFVQVRARVSGYLNSTNFVEGQIVQKGDLLCVIDPRPYEAELNKARSDIRRAESQVQQAHASVIQSEAEKQVADARLRLAEKQLARSRSLVQQNAVSQDDYDIRESEVIQSVANLKAADAQLELSRTNVLSAEAMLATAQANLRVAELDLEFTQIRSPITGRVSSRHVTEGNLISGGGAESTLITTIVSLNPIHCYFDADEQSYLKYSRLAREGKLGSSREVKHPVYVGLADQKDAFPYSGHTDFVDNRLDEETGTMRSRAILPNEDLSLTPGLFTRLRIPGSERYEAILVPDFAIGTDQSEKFVMIVSPENKIERRVVTLGPTSHGLRIIRSGLDGSEQIVARGLQRVRPGDVVAPEHEPTVPREDTLQLKSEPVPEEEWLSSEVTSWVPASSPALQIAPATLSDSVSR